MKYRLGLDVGTNSLGWSVLQLDENTKKPHSIESAGVRIFSDGRNRKNNTTLKAERRAARSARRRRDRFVQRRKYLIKELIHHGLFPADEAERKSLQILNPLELRALAIKQKLPLYHIGRALFHLNQRRGFKSNRKDRSQESRGVVADSTRLVFEEMNLIGPKFSDEEYKSLKRDEKRSVRQKEAKDRLNAIDILRSRKELTYGTFLWKRQQQGLSTRSRPDSSGKLYEIYPTRELYIDEFEKIWEKQNSYYPELLTDELKSHFKQIIYWQRPLRPQPLGKCMYFPNEDRTFRAMPSFQNYRIFQEVNNIQWGTIHGARKVIEDRTDRDYVVDLLQRPSTKNARVTFNKIRNGLIKREVMERFSLFNLESENRKFLDGNQTSKIMEHEDRIGTQWHSWSTKKQDRLVEIILNDELDDESVCEKLMQEFDLSEFSARNCSSAQLVEGTANLSLKAARELTELMKREMLIQSDAVIEAAQRIDGFKNPYTHSKDQQLLPNLPYYGKAVRGHIIPGTGLESDEQARIGMVSNPTVHIAMNQIRRVVNELIARFGHPYSIAIELARDLPEGQQGRAKIARGQNQYRKENDEYNKKLKEDFKAKPNRNNRLKIRLWEEQDKTCVFTGDRIGCSDLFSHRVEIEHLIPYSQSLDDSRANKVICLSKANRYKKNRTPYEAFGNSEDGYDWEAIYKRVQDLPKSKQWRFYPDARDRWESDGDFMPRHLNDTRYIARLAREYLENICKFNKIDVVTGRLTSELRHQWGLNSILDEIRDPNYSVSSERKFKNRDDHRHHAIDSIVIGMTTRSLIQQFSTEVKNQDELNGYSSWKLKLGLPWESFRKDVRSKTENIIVSHAVRRKQLASGVTDGQLHNETAYGLVEPPAKDGGTALVVTRYPIDYFDREIRIRKIRNPLLRKQLQVRFSKDGKNGLKNLAKKRNIRKIRCVERLSVIPITDSKRMIYKFFKGDSNWGMEIYAYPKGHPRHGNWDGVTITRFNSNNHNFQPGTTYRPHPTARLVMRLQIDDCVEAKIDGNKRILRVQKITIDTRIAFADHYEANVDSRNRNKKDSFKFFNKKPNTLRVLNPRKVNVSPTGIVS